MSFVNNAHVKVGNLVIVKSGHGNQYAVAEVVKASKRQFTVKFEWSHRNDNQRMTFRRNGLEERGSSRYSSYTNKIIREQREGFGFSPAWVADRETLQSWIDDTNAKNAERERIDTMRYKLRNYSDWRWLSPEKVEAIYAILFAEDNDEE